jgi:pectin methylesterase-like acyl-CoA thioesterase
MPNPSTTPNRIRWAGAPRPPGNGRGYRYGNNTGNGAHSGWFGGDAGFATGTPPTGGWTYIAYTYNGSTTNFVTYVNGAFNKSTTFAAALATAHNSLYVGNASGGLPFDGYIADVRVHTGVLSAANVLNNYNHGIQSILPVITGLSNQTVVAGNNLVLTAAVTGYPTPALQWRSNSIALSGQTNLSLTLNNLQYAQNGAVYSLVATNAAGKVTNNVTLTVLVTPEITDLNSQAVAPGADVTIAPTVLGVPTPVLQWRRSGTNLFDGATGSGSIIAGSTGATLFLTNAQVADTDTYSLVASNSVGIVTNSMTLTVSGGAVAPTISGPTDQTVVQGEDATFTASISGLPLPAAQWRLNGVDIAGATNDSLVVTNVQYAQNGAVYSVIASNSAGLATNSATLYVLVPPAISQQPTNSAVVVGNPALFSVTASGVPAVTYQWRKNGSPIANATNATYSIASVTGANNGEVFSVVVSNSVGSATSSNATLTALSALTRSLLPTNNATGLAHDQQLRIVFPAAVKLATNGVLTIHDAANGAVVSAINAAQFVSYTPGNTSIQSIPNAAIRSVQGKSYYYMPLAIYGNEVWITLSNRLAYNKTYYVNMDAGLLRETSTGASIPAITGTNTWRFSTKSSGPATPTTSTGVTTITVGQDGVGDFATFQGAFDWIPQNNTLARTIRVMPGIYRDNATLAQNRNFVTIVGEGASRTNAQLIYPFAFFAPPNTAFTAGSLRLESSDVSVVNLTLDNIIYVEYHPTGEPTSGAAGAFAGAINTLATTGRRLVFENVLIKGGQDTIYHDSSTGVAYFRDCEVWGSVDYIYGNGLAVYDQCAIVQIRSSGGPITAPNTAYAQPYGLVFLDSVFPRALTANGYPYNVNVNSTTFQRPWGQDGATAVINCQLDTHFTTKGWAEWDGRENTCRDREFGSTMIGGGVAPTPAARQAAGAYWLNTADPNYTSSAMAPTDASLAPPSGHLNRTNVTVNPADYTVEAIFGHAYFGLGSWRPVFAPVITAQPGDQTVAAGSPATVSLTALGLPEPTYQWRKNGTNIVGATNTTLIISAAKLADNASYSVLVSNSAGAIISSNAVLTVPAVAPTITPAFASGMLSLGWPVGQTGMKLEAQTNSLGVGLNSNWTVIPGSEATNQITLPIDPANPATFFRLRYP